MNIATDVVALRSRKFLGICLAVVRTARPQQWIKNVFVGAPLLFSGQIIHEQSVLQAGVATLAFIFASAATYFWNDLADLAHDLEHPIKRYRPIPSGQMSQATAVTVTIVLAGTGLGLGAYLNLQTFIALAGYLVLQILYTSSLKHLAIIDVLCIALGFIIRVLAGATAISVIPSSWLLVCTFFLATFLGFSKRRGEVVRLGRFPLGMASSRPVLIAYTDNFLLILLSVTCSLTVLSYALYAIDREPHSLLLLFTIPIVAYALFRYLLLTMTSIERVDIEAPEGLILRDPGLIWAGVLWVGISAMGVLLSTSAW